MKALINSLPYLGRLQLYNLAIMLSTILPLLFKLVISRLLLLLNMEYYVPRGVLSVLHVWIHLVFTTLCCSIINLYHFTEERLNHEWLSSLSQFTQSVNGRQDSDPGPHALNHYSIPLPENNLKQKYNVESESCLWKIQCSLWITICLPS